MGPRNATAEAVCRGEFVDDLKQSAESRSHECVQERADSSHVSRFSSACWVCVCRHKHLRRHKPRRQPPRSRNVKVNAQLIDIDGSPVNSVFGYYVGGQRGQTLAMDFSVLF